MTNLSILMPVKNGEKFLPRIISSIEGNVLDNDEIIIIDDGSEDRTQTILLNWARENQKVRIIRNPKSGLVEALNLGVQESKFNWIARFDVDDRYTADRLALQRALISDSVTAIFCDYEFFSTEETRLGIIPSPIFHQPTVLSLHFSQQTPHPGVLFNRTAVQSVGGYRSSDFPAEDISLWLRLARIGNFVSVPQVLLQYRLSTTSITGQNWKSAKKLTQSLVSEIGINSADVRYCLESWREFLDLYAVQNLSAERSVLFYRNLKRASQVAFRSNSYRFELKKMRNRIFSDFGNNVALFKLFVEQSRRHIHRRL